MSFSDILTFALIVLVSQITICEGMKNPDTLASCNGTEDHSLVVIGVAFSLIMIILQTKFLL